MTILVLGGRGKTAKPLADRLESRNISFLVGSRTRRQDGGSYRHVIFDWLDRTTYGNCFPEIIQAVYMVAPEVQDCQTPMREFIDYACDKGTKRFILLSSSAVPRGGPFFGHVHQYLATRGVEYSVLRPSWFQGIFTCTISL